MTAKELIDLADELAPNPFSATVKLREVNQIEHRVWLDALLEDPEDLSTIAAADIATARLALTDPYTDVYLLWMISRYYYHMGEYEEYENKKAAFEEAWNTLQRDLCLAFHKGTSPDAPEKIHAAQVTGVKLDHTSASLNIDDTLQLRAKVLPAAADHRDVSWASSDDDNLSVEDGLLTAIGSGTYTVTVTTSEGSLTATCSVTVAAIS